MRSLILISPTAIAFVPILLLHLVALGYLLLHGPRSRQTWLFCGWLGGMTLMTMTQCAARIVYAPCVSGYLNWWGGVVGVTLALVALIQFAYHFPRLRYPREARIALFVSLAITAALWGWTAWESIVSWPNRILATPPPRPDLALTPQATWIAYDFEHFFSGFAETKDAGFWVSFKFFDRWQILGNLWVFLVWVRKTIQFSTTAEDASPIRRVVEAFRHPQGREAHLSRAWMMLMLLAPLTVVASTLDASGQLPPGVFAAVHLVVFFAIILTYVNYAPEPTTMMVKLVGISLVTILVVLGLVSAHALKVYQQAYDRVRQAELEHVRSLIAEGDLSDVPAEVAYVASRSMSGLFAPEYQLHFTRRSDLDGAGLAAHDALLRQGLARDHFSALQIVRHENPWLGYTGVNQLAGHLQAIDQVSIPEMTPLYRGSTSYPSDHFLRYTFIEEGARYEVGYSYPAYRRHLHQKSLPLVGLLLGATLLILVIFPHFFYVGLVAPLAHLLEGVDRVDQGDLRGDIPVLMEDEIGRLTRAFNRMVTSLKASKEALHALNVSLEQRVVDRTRDLTTLYEVAALVNQPSSLNSLLSSVLDRVVDGVDAAAGIVLVKDPEDGRLRPMVTYQIPPDLFSWVASLPVLETAGSQAETLLIHDMASDSHTASLFTPQADPGQTFPYRTMASVPIPGQEGLLGLLIIFGTQPFLFNVEDLEVLASVAEQLSVAIENMRLRQRATKAVVWEERQRLARDLHDSVTQLLYSQVLFANAAGKALDAQQLEQTSHYLKRLSESAARALREMRLMLYRLRPSRLAEAGLVGALQRRLETVEQRAGIQVHFACEAAPDLPSAVEEALYHIAEEALNNALKHAAASQVTVELTYPPERACLSVTDDGRGFDVISVSQGLGLQNLRERAEALGGKVTVTSALGEGTCVVACLPLPPTRRKLDER